MTRLHLFRYKRANVALDGNRLAIYRISDRVKRILDMHYENKQSQTIANELRVRSDYVEKILNFCTNVDGLPPSSNIKRNVNLELNVTNKCMLACKYCYARELSGSCSVCTNSLDSKDLMSYKIAQKAVNFVLDLALKKNLSEVILTFMGGEPLLAYKNIKATLEYATEKAKAKGIRIHKVVATNGLLLSSEKIRFFKDNDFTVVISVDGRKSIHDKYRTFPDGRGTFDILLPRIHEQIKSAADRTVAAATITPENDMFGTFCYLVEELGFRMVNTNLVISPYVSSRNGLIMRRIIKGEKRIADYIFRELDEKHKWIKYNMISLILNAFLFKTRNFFGPCEAGSRTFGVDINGDVYPCSHFVGIKNLKLGNVKNINFDPEYFSPQNFFKETRFNSKSDCGDCWAQYVCGKGCPYYAFANYQNSSAINLECLRMKSLIEYTIGHLLYSQLSVEKNDIFPEFF